jgi:HAD superfamily hydrolase (TIGR01509 family)
MKPQLIIFDCDGVLIDSEWLALQALTEMLAENGVSLTLQEAFIRYAGKSAVSESGDLEKRYGVRLPPDFEHKKKVRRLQLFEERLERIPSISKLLYALQIKKCIASGSSPDRLRHSLSLVGLWDVFAPNIFSSAHVKNGKPAPDLFLLAAERMNTDPSECLVIEDSVAGVQAAKAAQMHIYGFTGGKHCDENHGERLLNEGAHRVFNHMDQIIDALHLNPMTNNEARNVYP